MAETGSDWTAGQVTLDGVIVRYAAGAKDRPSSSCTVCTSAGPYGTRWPSALTDTTASSTCPLGAHADAAPAADLSARATARRIPALLDALDLNDVTIVGNDTGGGICLAALGTGLSGLDRIGRLVLTNCDSYEHFPPKGFDASVKVSRRVPPLGRLLLRFFASTVGQRAFLKSVCSQPPKGADAAAIFESFTKGSATRRDALAVTQSLEPSVTLDAVGALKTFPKPVLLAWGDTDKLFPLDHARRLQADFPDACLEVMTGSSTFVMLDKPDELAAAIRNFATPA